MNIDVDYGNTRALAELCAAADEIITIGGWLAGDIGFINGFPYGPNNLPPRPAVEDYLAVNALMYRRVSPEHQPGCQQLISALIRYLGIKNADQVWALVENYHPYAQRSAIDLDLLSSIFAESDANQQRRCPNTRRSEGSSQ